MKIFNKKRNLLIIILTLLCMILCSSYVIKRINEAKKIKSWKKQYLDIAKEVDERVKLGGYSFRLKNVCYDIDSKSGYCYIEVESDKKNVRKLHLRDKYCGIFLNKDGDVEFEFYLHGNANQKVYSCFYHNKLCVLVFFDVAGNDTELDITISLDDLHEAKMNVYYPDHLSHKYMGEGEIWVTQYEIKIDYLQEELSSLSIVFKNGKEKVLIKDENVVGKVTSARGNDSAGKDKYWIYYGEYVDYKKIDYILLNGKKLKREAIKE